MSPLPEGAPSGHPSSCPVLRAAARSALVVVLLGLAAPGVGTASWTETSQAAGARSAPAFELSGRVLLGLDSAGVAGVPVDLHRVTAASGGIVASTRTGPGGRFRFTVDPGAGLNTGGVYLASARYAGLSYFGAPVHGTRGDLPLQPGDTAGPGAADAAAAGAAESSGSGVAIGGEAYIIRVYDTLHVAAPPPDVAVGSRRVAFSPAAAAPVEAPVRARAATLVERFEILNPYDRTLIPDSPGAAVWTSPLPAGAFDVELISPAGAAEDVRFADGQVGLRGALPPDGRELVVGYRVPAGEIVLPVGEPTARMELRVEEGVPVRVEGLARRGTVDQGGRSFARFAATGLVAGARVSLRPQSAIGAQPKGAAGAWWVWAAAGVVLLIGALISARRVKRPAALVPLAAVILAVSLAGFAEASPAPGDTIRVRDDAGNTVVLSAPARRIVSLVPALTEVLYAIGAGDRLVGRSRYADYPPRVAAVPSVGNAIRPSAELVLERRPDLVVLVAGADNAGSVRELERLGLPVLAVINNTMEDLDHNIGRLGRLTGRREAAEALSRRIDRELGAVRSATRGSGVVSVYYDVWYPPAITVGESYLDSLISLAGGRNVFGDMDHPSPSVGLEAIAVRDPDVILFPVEEEAPGARIPPRERPGWDVLGAVRAGRVVSLDADLLHRLGPRIGRAAWALARALHPEAVGPSATGQREAAPSR